MRTILRTILILTLIMLCGCQTSGRDPLLRLTFQVFDDEGRTVEAAKAEFGGASRPKSGGAEGEGARVSGLTDNRGIFTGEIAVWDATQAGYEVSKAGYYTSWASFSAYRRLGESGSLGTLRSRCCLNGSRTRSRCMQRNWRNHFLR